MCEQLTLILYFAAIFVLSHFQIWFVRIALLFKLRSFNSAEAELNAFGDFDKPDLFYEFYTTIYPGMKGDLLSLSALNCISCLLYSAQLYSQCVLCCCVWLHVVVPYPGLVWITMISRALKLSLLSSSSSWAISCSFFF